MGDLARKDNAQSIQPAQQGQAGVPAGYVRNEAGQLVPIPGYAPGQLQPTPNPVETRRVEHVFIPPPGGMGALGMPQIGQGAPGGQGVAGSSPAPGQQGVPVPAGQQTIIYINTSPPPQQPTQPTQPAGPTVQPQIIHHHPTNDDRPRRRAAPEKGLSIFGLAGLLLGAAAIYLHFKPAYNLNPLYVAVAGAAVSVLGFLGAITGGRSRAGLPFLAMLFCGALVAIGYGWDKPAIDEINKQLKKHNIDVKVPEIPKPADASPRTPATLPAANPPASKSADRAPLSPALPPPATSPVSIAPPAVLAVDPMKQAREAVDAAQRNLQAAQDRALANSADYQKALADEAQAHKDREAARAAGGTGLQDATVREMAARNRAATLHKQILAEDPATKSSEQILKDAKEKLAGLK